MLPRKYAHEIPVMQVEIITKESDFLALEHIWNPLLQKRYRQYFLDILMVIYLVGAFWPRKPVIRYGYKKSRAGCGACAANDYES
jgi:hypothetical protein